MCPEAGMEFFIQSGASVSWQTAVDKVVSSAVAIYSAAQDCAAKTWEDSSHGTTEAAKKSSTLICFGCWV